MELFAALLCAVRPFSGSPFPRPLVFIEHVTGFVVWSAFAFVELGCFVRPVRAFVLSELPLLVTRSSPKKKKKVLWLASRAVWSFKFARLLPSFRRNIRSTTHSKARSRRAGAG